MFDLDQFIDDCRAALAADKSHKNVREIGELVALGPDVVMAFTSAAVPPVRQVTSAISDRVRDRR